jgi:uncharacterized damage-inducible protein DinB
MKTIFQALAKYNGSVNQSVIELLKPLDKEKVMMKTKAYFPSIFETTLHLFFGDLHWLKRLKGAFKESKALSNTQLVSLEEKSLRKEFESDYTKLFQYRKQVDEVIIQFVDEVDENKLNSVIKYKNSKGQEIEQVLWKPLLHWFNHQTHHRGQVSVLLDMVGVDHDYSSLLTRI